MTKKIYASETLELIILEKGMSRLEFSNHVGISPSYLSQIIRGKRSLSPKLSNLIATELKVNFKQIFLISSGCKKIT